MCVKWIYLIYILSILKTTTQHFYRNGPEVEYIEESEDQAYLDDIADESTDYVDPEPRTQERRKHIMRYEPQQCMCSCNQCTPPAKPCCTDVCNYCTGAAASQSGISGTGLNSPSNVVYLPYPVPLVIPNMFKTNSSYNAESDNKPAVTEASITKVTNTSKALRSNVVENSAISGLRNTKELNPTGKRKNRPTWIPKYGIVPIPDHLAVKLMSQLTEVRALKSGKL